MSEDALLETLADIEELKADIGALAGGLGNEPVSFPEDGALELDGDGSLRLFDETIGLRGRIRAQAAYLGTDAAVDVFGTGESSPLRAGHNTGRFEFEAGLDAWGEGSVGNEGVTLSARAGLSTSLRVEHYFASPINRTRATAVRNLVLGARLPHLLDLRTLPAQGEAYSLERKLNLDFGLEASAGYQYADERALEIGEGLALPLQLGVEASLRAALGLGLYERMRLTVGRTAQLEDGWVRVRLQRERERRLTFGVTFALAMRYDLSSGLVALFEEAVDQVPTERLMDAAKQIAKLADPGALETVLSEELSEVIEDLVAEDIVDGLDGIIPFANAVVEAYESLDERVQSLWERLLAAADLDDNGPVVGWLKKIAELDPEELSVDTLFADDDIEELTEAIEAISGQSVEEMLFSDEALGTVIADAADVARKALDYLAQTPAEVIEKIQGFAERTGIESTVATLAALDSVDELHNEVSTRIRRFAERLAGKALDAFDLEDLERVKAWAQTAVRWLDPEDPDFGGGLLSSLRERLAEVKADYGLSIGFEIDRVTRESALLDLELDSGPQHRRLRRKVSRALRKGQAAEVLKVLAEASGAVEKSRRATHEVEDNAGFLLRECAFASERVRSSATSVLFNLAGLGRLIGGKERGFTRRIEQSTLRISDRLVTGALPGEPIVNAANRFRREGRFAAGYQRGARTGSQEIESAIWHVAKEKGFAPNPLPDPAFVGSYQSSSLRLSFTCQDETPSDRESIALYRLLNELGFSPAGDDGPTTAGELMSAGPAWRLGFEIRFDGTVLETVGNALQGEGDGALFRRAFLNACHRFYSEGLVTRGRLSASPPVQKTAGEALARMLSGSSRVRAVLTGATMFHQVANFDTIRVDFADVGEVDYQVGGPGAGDREPLTPYLFGIQWAHRRGLRRLVEDDRFDLRAGCAGRWHPSPERSPYLRAEPRAELAPRVHRIAVVAELAVLDLALAGASQCDRAGGAVRSRRCCVATLAGSRGRG